MKACALVVLRDSAFYIDANFEQNRPDKTGVRHEPGSLTSLTGEPMKRIYSTPAEGTD